MDKVDLGSHVDELVEAAIFELDFAEPTKGVDVEESGFFTDFTDGGLLGGLTRLNVAFGDGPAILAVLD